jgi:hypothetical protein
LKPEQPGPFSAQLHVFIEDEGVREIVLSVQGTAHAAEPAGR